MSLLIYRSVMAGRVGRPVERPTQLSAEQRQQAQERTRHWRERKGLSQKDMASEIGVSYSAYRTWESSKDSYAGPTRAQCEQLDKALRRLLPDEYAADEAFDVWGWPRQQDMSYDRVVDLLGSTGFQVPRLKTDGQPPVRLLWVHRVREANLVHGVFALAAAAVTRAGLSVHLLLDDMALNDRRGRDPSDELEYRIRTWIAFASGDDTNLSTSLFSSVLTEEYLAERGWSAVNDYLNAQSSVLD